MSVSLDLTAAEREELQALLGSTDAAAPTRSLNELIGGWARLVTAIERGYDDSIYEYTNDLGVRDRLEGLIQAAPSGLRAKIQSAVAPLDARFTTATEQAARPLSAAGSQFQAWWHRVPTRRDGELADDLEALGHIE